MSNHNSCKILVYKHIGQLWYKQAWPVSIITSLYKKLFKVHLSHKIIVKSKKNLKFNLLIQMKRFYNTYIKKIIVSKNIYQIPNFSLISLLQWHLLIWWWKVSIKEFFFFSILKLYQALTMKILKKTSNNHV